MRPDPVGFTNLLQTQERAALRAWVGLAWGQDKENLALFQWEARLAPQVTAYSNPRISSFCLCHQEPALWRVMVGGCPHGPVRSAHGFC